MSGLRCRVLGHAPQQASVFWRDGFVCCACREPVDIDEWNIGRWKRLAALLAILVVVLAVCMGVLGGGACAG